MSDKKMALKFFHQTKLVNDTKRSLCKITDRMIEELKN